MHSAKEIAAGLRELHTNNDDTRTFLRTAADYIERTAAPADLPLDRDTLGRMVREAWVRWAKTQPNPKASWLLPYDDLSEPDKEADRQIGEAIAKWTTIHEQARASLTAPAAPVDLVLETTAKDRRQIGVNYSAWEGGTSYVAKLIRDLDTLTAALAAANERVASETKRADEAEKAEGPDVRRELLRKLARAEAERDREAAARREADERWRANMQNAWSALAMIREAVEEFGPVAALESEDAVLLRGPGPVHAAEAIIDALGRIREQAREAERDHYNAICNRDDWRARAEQAETERATLRAALKQIVECPVRLSDPLEFREIARAALATTSAPESPK